MRTKSMLVVCSLVVALLVAATPAEAGRAHFSVHINPYWWGWGPYWGGYYYRPYYPAPVLATGSVGAVDLNVKPKRAILYVDGELAGKAGRFDGFPGYLWLDAGDHRLVLVHDGYATVAKEIEVRAGMLTDVRLEMAPGESRPATDFFVTRARPAQAPEAAIEPYSPRERSQAVESDRGRVRRRSEREGGGESLDARVESARLKVEITPADASVYLDGRFLGTVADLERLHAGILLDPGSHTLSAVRPGYEGSSLEFEAQTGEELVLRIDLRRE